MNTSTWKEAFDFIYTDNGVSVMCTDCSFQEQVGTFDTTNNQSAGFSEFGVDVKTYNIRGSVVIDEGDVRMPSFKDLVDITFNDGINTFSGKGRMTGRDRTGAGRGGYKISFTGAFTGAVTGG